MDDDEEFGEQFGSLMDLGTESTEAEKEFAKILDQIREAEGLKMYADVYTKLYDSYYQAKAEKDEKQAEINQIKQKMRKFDDTIASYQADITENHKTIESLRAQVEEARALADAMHARELASVESLDTMKKTLTRLEKELDARKRAGEDEGSSSAAKEKEKFEKEKIRLNNEIEGYKQRLANCVFFNQELSQKNTTNEETIAKLEEAAEDAENNAVRSTRLIEHLRKEIDGLKEMLVQQLHSLKAAEDKVTKLHKTVDKRDAQIRDLQAQLEAAKVEMEALTAKAKLFRQRYDDQVKDFERNKMDLMHCRKELKGAIDDGVKLRLEVGKFNKLLISLQKKYQRLEAVKSDLEGERDGLRAQVSTMDRDIMLSKNAAEQDRREIENLHREKEILNKNMQKIQNEASANLDAMAMQEAHRKQLDHEIELNCKQIAKQRLMLRAQDKEKDRLLEEAIALNEKIDELSDEVRLRVADIMDLKKLLREETNNSRKLSTTLDATRTEKNMLQKNYTEAADEIQDLKQKLKMLAYQIEQLKEDMALKESGLKSCENMLGRSNKKIEILKMEIQKLQQLQSEARADIAALRQEEARLNKFVQEGDTLRNKMVKELEGMMNERDVVGAQLVRRNDEISLLYEKIRILEVTLHRGERQYEQRVEDIRLLRLEILRLRKEKNLLSKGIENMTDLRLEVFNLERELGRERLRVRALEEALETPLNVHRWRKLQGTDPATLHLTQKLRLTQKKILVQSEMLVLKDRELKETRNLYGAMKDMLALQPSPEIQQTLSRTQKALTAKTNKMKCLVGELSMRERQVTDLRRELDRAHEEIHEFKAKYYELKRALDADEARRLRIVAPKTPLPLPKALLCTRHPDCHERCPYRVQKCPRDPGCHDLCPFKPERLPDPISTQRPLEPPKWDPHIDLGPLKSPEIVTMEEWPPIDPCRKRPLPTPEDTDGGQTEDETK